MAVLARVRMAVAVVLVAACNPGIGSAQDASGEVLQKLEEHFARMVSVHVRYTDRSLAEGGIRSEAPLTAKRTYVSDDVIREWDLWHDPPRRRELSARRTVRGSNTPGEPHSRHQTYYDGSVFTFLNLGDKSGHQVDGASRLSLPEKGVLGAIGFCFIHTFDTRLGELLSDRSRVTVEPVNDPKDGVQWIIEVKGFPKSVRPKDWSDRASKLAVVKIWATVAPDVEVKRWALYMPRTSNTPGPPGPIPVFDMPGYRINYCFINCDSAPVTDRLTGRQVRLPRRVLHGNPFVNEEALIHEISLNPRADEGTFRPAIPQGYAITVFDKGTEGRTEISGGASGTVARVAEITGDARRLLSGGEGLRSNEGWLSRWAWPLGLGVLAVSTAGAAVWLRRRKS